MSSNYPNISSDRTDMSSNYPNISSDRTDRLSIIQIHHRIVIELSKHITE
jgi:hypothetical protein